MRLTTLLATLAATCTLVATAAHARPVECDDYQKMGEYLSDSEDFGNSEFGGGYNFGAGLYVATDSMLVACSLWDDAEAIFCSSSVPIMQHLCDAQKSGAEQMIDTISALDTLENTRLGGAGSAEVTMFGKTRDVLDLGGYMSGDGGEVWLEVMGATVIDESFSGFGSYILSQTFFTARTGVDLFIFEISAKAELNGMLGANGMVQNFGTVITGSLTPFVGLGISVEAIVDVAFASAGVRGSLSLMNVSLPIVGNISTDGWAVTVDMVITALEGSLEAFGSFLTETATVPLIDVDGETLFDAQLFSDSGTF